ncbi:hypothetical protein, partial [Streptomyces sp. NPDC047009]|uniref:hypothetical protein n=1 Tax=Streptomyces sp. NPDC047009 TaxID=3154496 RepID=UPI0033EE1621
SRNGASYDRRFPPMTLNFPFSHASTLRGEGHQCGKLVEAAWGQVAQAVLQVGPHALGRVEVG